MGDAKNIEVKLIEAKVANEFVKKNHYSGKVVNNSKIHFGVFYLGGLHGVMSFGPSLDKRKTMLIVKETGWNELIELNRMAFDEFLPRNSESRALSVAFKMIKKYAPTIKWIISFADAGQCGSGTIYRASGFVLTAISKNSIFANAKGEKYQQASISARGTRANKEALKIQFNSKEKKGLVKGFCEKKGLNRIAGYSLRYIYFIDKEKIKDLNCAIIPFEELDKLKFPDGVRHKEYLKPAVVV